jgi:hypothetical protein
MKYSSIVLLILAQNIFYAQPGIDPIRVDQISTEPVKIEPQNIIKDITAHQRLYQLSVSNKMCL